MGEWKRRKEASWKTAERDEFSISEAKITKMTNEMFREFIKPKGAPLSISSPFEAIGNSATSSSSTPTHGTDNLRDVDKVANEAAELIRQTLRANPSMDFTISFRERV